MKTKSLITVLVWVLFLPGSGFADTSFLGFEAGINFADLNGTDVNPSFGSRLGAVGGGLAHLGLIPGLAFQPEILYTQKGAKFSNGGTDYQLDYVEIPVLVELSLGLPGINPGILLGPSIDWNVMMKGLPNINPMDTGIIAGLQLHFEPILLSGRYEVGLTNVTSDQNMQNGTFTFLLGIAFI